VNVAKSMEISMLVYQLLEHYVCPKRTPNPADVILDDLASHDDDVIAILERDLNLKISEEEWLSVLTVQDAINLVKKHYALKEKAA
jgi:hypothetical protein